MRGTVGNLRQKCAETVQLKRRLQEFWNAQQLYWELSSAGKCVESPNRERAASFVRSGDSVLDVACGTAANAAWLKDRCRYFGVDLSVTALQQPVRPSLKLACGDADQLPFRAESFDAVIATYVVEHAVDPVETLKEMFRVVRRGGKVILLGPAWDFPFWYPNSLRSRGQSHAWWLRYSLGRLWRQLLGWWFGHLPFERVQDPDAFHYEFIYDADAVYIVWSYEVIRLMKRWGHRLVHWDVDDRLLGDNPIVRFVKLCLLRLPTYRRAGNTILMVFEK